MKKFNNSMKKHNKFICRKCFKMIKLRLILNILKMKN